MKKKIILLSAWVQWLEHKGVKKAIKPYYVVFKKKTIGYDR